MATPESNALLAMQLMGAPFQQYNAQNDARTNLQFKLAAMQREEQLKRDLATQGYDKAIELANMQGTREDARWTNADTRAAATETARDTRVDKQLAAQQKLAETRADQSDAKQLRSLISKTYHEYALEAEEAGIDIQPRDEFPDDDEGLGALTVAYAKAKKANQRTKQKGIAQLAGAELTAAADEFKKARTQLEELAKPNDDDNEQAKLIAVANVQKAIQGAAKPPPPVAVKNGLAALDRGDLPEAKKLLGAEIFSTYESGFQQALRGLLNTPARRQQIAEASRSAQGIQARLKDMTHSYRVGAAQNPELAAEVVRVLTPLERMMQELPKVAPTYDQNPLLNPGGTTGVDPNAPKNPPVSTNPTMGFGGRFGGAFPAAPQTPGVTMGFGGVIGTPTPAPVVTPTADRAPYSFGQDIRNMIGLPPLTREGYGFDLQKLNDQFQYQNERGRATTLQQLQRLLIRAQTDPALAPGN